MDEKKYITISISKLIYCVIILILIIVIFFLVKSNNENKLKMADMEQTLIELKQQDIENKTYEENNKISNVTNETKNTTVENTNTQTNVVENNSVISKPTNNSSNNIVGKWHTYDVYSEEDNAMLYNFMGIFGTSYSQYGSYLEFESDGTFIDNIHPVQPSDISTEGTYKVLENYNKIGDCYVELKYSDGTTKMLQKAYSDEKNSETLTLIENGYHYYLKK